MSIEIYMYAEKRLNGVWSSCYPLETIEEDGKTSYSVEAVYSNDENDGNYPLSRNLLDYDRVGSPRGLPDDISTELRKLISWREANGWKCNYPSWLLLRELLERMTTVTGLVNAEQYVIFRKNGQPERVTSAAVGRGSRKSRDSSIANYFLSFFRKSPIPDPMPTVVTNEEMDQLVADGNLSSRAITEIIIKNADSEDCRQVFLQHTIPLLQTFGEPDDVRIVFWF